MTNHTDRASTRILVAGATGYLGRHVVAEAVGRGHTVVGLARRDDEVEGCEQMIVADASDPARLAGCCDGIDVVFSSIGIVGKLPRGVKYDDVDHHANTNLLREAERAGATRFVYISVFAPGGDDFKVVRAKHRFEAELAQSSLAHTVIRPNGYFSDIDNFLTMAQRGRAYVFGSGDLKMNPIHGADLATIVADHFDGGDEVVTVGGPEVLTHAEIVAAAFDAAGGKPKTTHVPLWIPKMLISALPRLTPERVHGPAQFLLAVLSRDMVAPTAGRRTLAAHFREVIDEQGDR